MRGRGFPLLLVVRFQLNSYSFNFVEHRVCEQELKQSRQETPLSTRRGTHKEEEEETSATEYEVDALAQRAEEGRGDRRNVRGELHTSEEPRDSEWGNPSRVMSGDRLLNT